MAQATKPNVNSAAPVESATASAPVEPIAPASRPGTPGRKPEKSAHDRAVAFVNAIRYHKGKAETNQRNLNRVTAEMDETALEALKAAVSEAPAEAPAKLVI